MQTCSRNGLAAAAEGERRCTIKPIINGNEQLAETLLSIWAAKGPDEAHAVLEGDDIRVTNAGDKATQLGKLLKLDIDVVTEFRLHRRKEGE